ncbi:hypothetical protein G7Z17_g4666 [Cylindrodendrum hubeiense]|uniref:Uncharacterized protein n=1 Tax=Cylindrodendrum hubeiense TaxID=595255 RepID=A0A9P5HEG0_9HYPO|nr:hypothetical protein G7Z17_g4666 [Cylindrodendrum hubeiense]
MRSFVAYSLLASATFASALERRWDYPAEVPALHRRQAPGTPAYACHENCGLLITLGREEGFCDNAEWNERYGKCMICANTFEIWVYYKNGVTSAAEQCDLSPTPSPSGWVASSTAAEVEESTTAVVEVPTTAAPEPTTSADAAETTAPEAETTAPVAEETTAPEAEATETTAAGETDAEATSEAVVETTGSVVPTTLSTAAVESKSASESAAGASETDSAATHTTGGSIGTIGVTPTTPASTPSTVIVSGAAKQLSFGAAFGAVAVAMLAV